jgi:predicted nucleotidyltransferase
MINLESQELAIIQKILRQHLPASQVHAFGSRVKNTAKPWSDLDLLIHSPKFLGPEIMGRCREAFENSSLTFRVELVERSQISESFWQEIESDLILIQSQEA